MIFVFLIWFYVVCLLFVFGPSNSILIAFGTSTNRYDIVGLDNRASESCDGIEASVERVRNILMQENQLGEFAINLSTYFIFVIYL